MKTPGSAYRSQKGFAKQRGIKFVFEFEDWVNWWEEQLGAYWFKKRGCRRGQYVMARFGDRGPYARHNVKCILSSDNHVEYNMKRKPSKGWSHPVLEKQIVRDVYKSTKPYLDLVDEFQITSHQIQCIKSRKYFLRFTKDLGEPGRPWPWTKKTAKMS